MKILPIHNEKDLLMKLRNRDQQTFEQLYAHYKKHIIGHLLYIFKSDELAQDITQETFIAVWENCSQIDPEKSFKAFLFTIATNKAYDLLRKANVDKRLHAALSAFMEKESNQVEEYILRKEHSEQLNHILLQMPEQQRKVYQLAKIEGYSYDEIAKKIGVSRHTVNTHIKRANAFLREQILNKPESLAFFLAFALKFE
ncbi:MAG TPA: RNA polymerase sigma-70 factor [Sphingobacterium sp.]|nr:RNA polymerase sigma-70 factor [Sphingobacterium sp.]